MTATDSFRVDESWSGTRLDRWLAQVSGRPRADVQRLIGQGLVLVDGRAAAKSMKVAQGQLVEVTEPAAPAARDPAGIDVPVRYEDDDLAVIAKPPGLVVHPAGGTRSATVVDVLARRMPLAEAAGEHRPGIVHRLDKGTSGLMLIAKTDAAYHGLVERMKAREISRTYRALVVGGFDLPTGRIEAPVGRSVRRPTSMTVSPKGKQAVTEFEVLEELGDLSFLSVKLLTGRTHQIRVHLAHIHRPVVGDRQYGGGAGQLAAALGLTRPFLHAHALEFEHPISLERIRLEEPLPDDLQQALLKAREAAA